MARRQRKRSYGNPMLAVLALIALLSLRAITRDPGFLVFLLGVALLLVGLPVGLLWLLNSAKWKRLRVLRLADVDQMSGHQFEHYIATLLQHQGYQTTVTPGSGDLGGDVIAKKGDLRYIVQTKRYSNGVGRTAVSDAVGAMAHYRCNSCMVVTTNWFTAGARQLAQSNNCVLIDRDTLAEWILDFQGAQLPGSEPAGATVAAVPPQSASSPASPTYPNQQAQRIHPLPQARPTGSHYVKICPRCQRTAALEMQQCTGCGHMFRTRFTQPA